MSDYLLRRQQLKIGNVKQEGPKDKKPLKRVSEKKAAEMKEAKEAGESEKEAWFKERRKELTGVCQCGCAQPSSKNDDQNFRSSIAHIFPKALFKSIQYHPLNYVERNFWYGCHSNMDNRSISLWPNMADWDDIKEKFKILSHLLTREEKAKKFYGQLEKLVNEN